MATLQFWLFANIDQNIFLKQCFDSDTIQIVLITNECLGTVELYDFLEISSILVAGIRMEIVETWYFQIWVNFGEWLIGD